MAGFFSPSALSCVEWKCQGASRCVPLWVDSCTFSTAQPSPSGRSFFCRPGKKGWICSTVLSCVKYSICGAKGGGSESTSFSR
jgi:hypothetical protein